MSGGRWDPQTRIAVVVVGMLVVTIGALSTLQWRSGVGAAALVIGGLLVSLAGVAGGTIFGPREVPEIHVVTGQRPTIEGGPAGDHSTTVEARRGNGEVGRDASILTLEVTPADPTVPAGGVIPTDTAMTMGSTPTPITTAGTAHDAGDTEGAAAALLAHLRMTAPQAVTYYESVRDTVAATVEGRTLSPLSGHVLGPFSIAGLPVAVDARAGTGFSPASVRETYHALVDGPAEITAILVVVNSDPTSSAEVTDRLRAILDRTAVVVVPWRVGDPTARIVEGLARTCGDAGRRPAATVPPAQQTATVPPAPLISSASSASSAKRQAQRTPLPQPRRTGQSSARQRTHHDDTSAWHHARNLHWRGKHQEAEKAYRTIVENRSRALGWNHLDTLTARDQHATALRDLDRLAEALVECDEVLHARTMLLGPDHVDTLTSRSHLATIYHQLGDLTRAQTEHRRVLEARVRVLGTRDVETLISRSNLAKVYQDLGELDLAIEEHEIVMYERSEVLGTEHRDTLMSRSLLASALHQASRLEEAESQHRAVLVGRMRENGPTHLDTAVSRHRLASVLHDLNRLDEAIVEYQAAREVYTELLGPSSPFARAAASDLALAERALRTASAAS